MDETKNYANEKLSVILVGNKIDLDNKYSSSNLDELSVLYRGKNSLTKTKCFLFKSQPKTIPPR